MSGAAKPADLMEPGLRRNPGEPDAAQAEANSYGKPTMKWQGLTIAIENPAGSVRRGRNRHGVTWEVRMRFDYGEIVGTLGVDGDPVDVIVGPSLDAPIVYVVHQRRVNDWENYDEDKCCVGFSSQSDAEQAFLSNYNDPRFLGPVTAMPVAEFVAKVKATKDKPAMIKSVLFFKAHVGAYLRGGKLVNVTGYQGRNARPVAGPGQMSLFGGPMSGMPLGPSPLNGKDAVAHTPDLFSEPQHTEPTSELIAKPEEMKREVGEHDHLLADFPEGSKWSRGNGRIKGHYAVELPGGDVVGNYHENPEHAVGQAKDWLASRATVAKEKSDRAAAIGALRDRLMSGGEATASDLKLLGLKEGSSGLKWFIPAAAEVFGITSHAVRPHIKDMIRVGHTDMGSKLEFVNPAKALAAIAAGMKPAPVADPAADVTVTARKRIKDDLNGTHTELKLSNGQTHRIQRLNSTESMGLPGWHHVGANDLDSPTSMTYIADTEQDAISDLVSRANKDEGSRVKANPGLYDGTIIRDGHGKLYRVHYNRNSLVVAHPIVNGKPNVNADTTIRFWTNPDQIPAGENDRTDPIFVVGAPMAKSIVILRHAAS